MCSATQTACYQPGVEDRAAPEPLDGGRRRSGSYWMVDFGMVGVLLLHLVVVLLLLLPLLLVQSLQVLLPVVLLQHLVLLELLVPLLVKVLQVVGGLDENRGLHRQVRYLNTPPLRYREGSTEPRRGSTVIIKCTHTLVNRMCA